MDEKVGSLSERIEKETKLDEEKKNYLKKELKDLVDEYNTIKDEAKAKFEFSDKLLEELEKDYLKNEDINGALKIFCKISQEIIDTNIKYFIEFEKKLILIIDKFNSLNF